MSCSVNLVPPARAQARERLRRRRAWLGVAAAGVLALGAGMAMQHVAGAGLVRLSRRVDALEAEHSDVQRRLLTADGRRTALLQKLEVMAEARRPQPWARRLAELARAAPEGVYLREMRLAAADLENGAATAAGLASAATRAPAVAGAGQPVPVTPPAPGHTEVRLLGYALDHAALLRLLNVLQDFPDFQQVELVRATLEPHGGGVAVAFELACRTREGGS